MNKNRSKSANTADTNLHLTTVVLRFYDCSNKCYFKRLKQVVSVRTASFTFKCPQLHPTIYLCLLYNFHTK